MRLPVYQNQERLSGQSGGVFQQRPIDPIGGGLQDIGSGLARLGERQMIANEKAAKADMTNQLFTLKTDTEKRIATISATNAGQLDSEKLLEEFDQQYDRAFNQMDTRHTNALRTEMDTLRNVLKSDLRGTIDKKRGEIETAKMSRTLETLKRAAVDAPNEDFAFVLNQVKSNIDSAVSAGYLDELKADAIYQSSLDFVYSSRLKRTVRGGVSDWTGLAEAVQHSPVSPETREVMLSYVADSKENYSRQKEREQAVLQQQLDDAAEDKHTQLLFQLDPRLNPDVTEQDLIDAIAEIRMDDTRGVSNAIVNRYRGIYSSYLDQLQTSRETGLKNHERLLQISDSMKNKEQLSQADADLYFDKMTKQIKDKSLKNDEFYVGGLSFIQESKRIPTSVKRQIEGAATTVPTEESLNFITRAAEFVWITKQDNPMLIKDNLNKDKEELLSSFYEYVQKNPDPKSQLLKLQEMVKARYNPDVNQVRANESFLSSDVYKDQVQELFEDGKYWDYYKAQGLSVQPEFFRDDPELPIEMLPRLKMVLDEKVRANGYLNFDGAVQQAFEELFSEIGMTDIGGIRRWMEKPPEMYFSRSTVPVGVEGVRPQSKDYEQWVQNSIEQYPDNIDVPDYEGIPTITIAGLTGPTASFVQTNIVTNLKEVPLKDISLLIVPNTEKNDFPDYQILVRGQPVPIPITETERLLGYRPWLTLQGDKFIDWWKDKVKDNTTKREQLRTEKIKRNERFYAELIEGGLNDQ